ncbi:MAG: Long-chain-fatty-acid--CoA ligase FadD15 [Alphaproteobacteria bacterium MarineAlpha5_Bin5]|nr:MAG: Long-chain-fatty-acid--CoA ligase FadD15 [Alphaproteobacteria bacterium MarineAlpha5_Bin5]|tara:strand:- start:4136 stop:5887 length:1752 start_codon:yes stop_codon:yes gene_type:complete
MFFEKSNMMKDKPYLWKKNNNIFESLSWEDVELSVKSVARSLMDLGVLKGDRVVILSENRPEWQIADLAIMSIGAITVPVYTTSTTADYSHVINHSGARCMIISSHELCVKALPAVESSTDCKNVIKINDDGQSYSNPVNILQWSDLIKNQEKDNYVFDEEIKSIKRTDTACIIYTSGTGGNPKGVMLSHGAMLSNCTGAQILLKNLLEGMDEIKFLSWLPLSHSYEHTLQFFTLGIGAQVYYSEGIDKLVVNMGEVSPHFMTAVPRFYDSLHTRISQGLKKQGKLSQCLFAATLRLGKKKYNGEKLSFLENLTNSILDKLVRRKVNKRFGGSLKALISGGSALNFEVGLYLTALGLPLLQGYGQTETAPVVSANPPEKVKLDTVGPLFHGVNVKIADDGEILVSGENVMNGYWNDPDATSKTLINGWIHTGDIGEFDGEDYLKITDRKKDILVNAGGDNISPSRVEAKLDIEPEIAQSMLYGDFKNYLVAVIVPDKDFALNWAKENSKDKSLESIVKEDDFNQVIKEVVNRVNKNLSVIEQVRKFILIDHEFTIENSMMTPSMKVRRFVVKDKYGEKLESLY